MRRLTTTLVFKDGWAYDIMLGLNDNTDSRAVKMQIMNSIKSGQLEIGDEMFNVKEIALVRFREENNSIATPPEDPAFRHEG